MLQNDDVEAGIPLTLQDGAVLAPSEAVTVVGFFDADLSVFDDNNAGPIPTVMSTRDGAWSALNGATGPDSTENKVLIGQFTTDGVFEFELNLQLRNELTLGVEKYVARDPVGVSILGPQAGELIGLWSLAISARLKLSAIAGTVLPYPTLGEISKRAAGAYFSPKLFASPVLKRVVRL